MYGNSCGSNENPKVEEAWERVKIEISLRKVGEKVEWDKDSNKREINQYEKNCNQEDPNEVKILVQVNDGYFLPLG